MSNSILIDEIKWQHGNESVPKNRRALLALIFLLIPLSQQDVHAADASPPFATTKKAFDQFSYFSLNATPKSGGFEPREEPPTAAFSLSTVKTGKASTALLPGSVLVACWVANKRISASAEVYNPSTDSWFTAGVVTSSRDSRNAVFPRTKRMLIWGGIVIPF